MRTSKFIAILLTLGFAAGACGLQAQEEREGRREGRFYVPGTSLERPEDVGRTVHTNHRILAEPAGGMGPAGGMSPSQLWSFYGVTGMSGATVYGSGVIAIVDAYDYPTALNDFNVFSNQFGLPIETSTSATAGTNKVFQVVYASGKKPRANGGWAQEAALDIEWAHAMAPGAKIVLVEAASASFSDMYAAVDVAKKIAGVKQVSMSWGGSETSTEAANDSHFNAATGPVFFASSGDTGGKVIYPSASSFVVSVGGTSVATSSAGAFSAESAWTSGGGGPSAYIARPSWQTASTAAKRGTPDISADADPNTGVAVYDSYSYQGYSGWMVFGGTSASAPAMAGMLNATGKSYANTTAFLTSLYTNFKNTPSNFRDITAGNNGYAAAAGYDYTTGVGAPTSAASF